MREMLISIKGSARHRPLKDSHIHSIDFCVGFCVCQLPFT